MRDSLSTSTRNASIEESIDERIEDSLTLGGDAILTSAPGPTPVVGTVGLRIDLNLKW
jgi:hypothetical protein